jgi:hypothetical protein|tara:strand:- start:3261 stop:3533 length:273 start_codon:yes stop_codon:yes gene_type:complete
LKISGLDDQTLVLTPNYKSLFVGRRYQPFKNDQKSSSDWHHYEDAVREQLRQLLRTTTHHSNNQHRSDKQKTQMSKGWIYINLKNYLMSD